MPEFTQRWRFKNFVSTEVCFRLIVNLPDLNSNEYLAKIEGSVDIVKPWDNARPVNRGRGSYQEAVSDWSD